MYYQAWWTFDRHSVFKKRHYLSVTTYTPFYSLSLRKLPCIHTRYIFNCLFRFTSSRRSTPSRSISNKGCTGQWARGWRRLWCTSEVGCEDGLSDTKSGISVGVWHTGLLICDDGSGDGNDVLPSSSSSPSITSVIVDVLSAGEARDPVNIRASSSECGNETQRLHCEWF